MKGGVPPAPKNIRGRSGWESGVRLRQSYALIRFRLLKPTYQLAPCRAMPDNQLGKPKEAP